MKIAGCVVLFNPNKEVLDHIDTYINDIDHLYIFDNSENKQFLNQLKKHLKFSKMTYMTEEKNKGIAYALNICAHNARQKDYKWLLTMDQDSYFEKNTVKEMKKMINCDTAIIAPKYDIAEFYNNDPLVVMTSGNLLNLKVHEQLNGFEEYFFIDMVDYEYCLKVRKNSFKITTCKKAILKHQLGNIKSKKIFNKTIFYTNHNAKRRYYITRNRFLLNEMYHKDYPEFCKKELQYNRKELMKIILFEQDKWKKLKAYYQAKHDYRRWKYEK